jgi:hypothetical protein
MIIFICTVLSIVTRLLVGRQRNRGSFPGMSKIFLFSNTSISALLFTQPPIWRVPGLLSPGVMRPGREPDHCHQISRLRISGPRFTVPKMPLWRSHKDIIIIIIIIIIICTCAVKLRVNKHPLNWTELNYWWCLCPTARRCRYYRLLHANHKSPLHIWGSCIYRQCV